MKKNIQKIANYEILGSNYQRIKYEKLFGIKLQLIK
jgi:hypothetical protein